MRKKISAYCILISACFLVTQTSHAQTSANEVLEQQLKKKSTPAARLETLMVLCKNYSLSDLSKASHYGKKALIIAEQLKDDHNKKAILKNLIRCGLTLNEFDYGLQLMQDGLNLSRVSSDKKSECDFLYLAGMLYRKKEKDSLVRQNFDSALNLSLKIKYPEGEGNALRGLGLLSEKHGDKEKSRQYYNAALKLAHKTRYDLLEIITLNSLGSSYLIEGDHQKALEYYILSVKKAEETGNMDKLTEAYGNMAIVYKDIGDREKAIEQNLKALHICRKTKSKTQESFQYDNLAACYNELGKYDEAMKYARLCLITRNKINDPKLICYSLITIANIYKAKKDYSNALDYYRRGLAIGEKIKHVVFIGRTNTEIGDVLLHMNNPKEAKKYLKVSLDILNKAGTLKPQISAYRLLADACLQMNEKDSAYYYLQQHIAVKDSVVEEDRMKAISKMQVQFETKEKESQIKFLEKESVLQASLLKKNKQLKTGYLIGLVLFCLLAFLFFNRARLKQKNNNLLRIKNIEIEEQNIVIEKSLKEKETLLREIHHRVKNNLQIISSLLNIQSSHIQDENVLFSIQEGQNRVQAMSLIHQNLYQSEHLNNVDIQNYVQQLVNYLSEMFTGQSTYIQVNVDAPDISFDIDTAIPLGLIINELVSNAYKYAFEKQSPGNISISIKPKAGTDYELEIRDNGKGMPADINPDKSSSLGLKLVKILSRQLRGTFSFKSDKGAVFLVQFKDLRAYQIAQS